jgi:tetratricopeptide (TPR) repeat protein
MKGLSQDLYALADSRHGVKMSPEERKRWAQEANVLPSIFVGGDVDAILQFLREPFPSDLPAFTISFLQARCWERLGDHDVALVFMKEAARLDPRQMVCVLLMAQRLGRTEEEIEYAERIVRDEHSTAEELYQAAVTLSRPALEMGLPDAAPILQKVVSIAERALRVFRTTPKQKREIPTIDREIIMLLGLCYEQLGRAKTAIQLYSDAIARYPHDPALLTFRGIALIESAFGSAVIDFRNAVQAGSRIMWPYYFLAWRALVEQHYFDTWRLCLDALNRPGGSNQERAQLHEWLGIALAESGQSLKWALENFDIAQSLDPDNDRIRQNRAIAEARGSAWAATMGNGWVIGTTASREQAQRGVYGQEQPEPDMFSERIDANFAALLQAVA